MADKFLGQITADTSADGDQILFNDISDTTADATGTPKIETKATFLSGKSDIGHTHVEADITDLGDYATNAELTTGLATKANTSHTHDDSEINAAASATNYTPSAATVEGHLSGIDTALASAGGGGGQTLYTTIVDASGGGDYTTVGAAIAGGATSIFVRNGTYVESARTISTPNVTIVGESSVGVVLNIGSTTWIVDSAADHFTLDNITILSSNGQILFNTTDDWTIRNSRINFNQTSLSVIEAYNCTRGSFANNRCVDTGTSAGVVRFSFGDGEGIATNITGNVFRINPMEANNISIGSLNNFVGNTVQHNGGAGTGPLVTGGGICNITGNYLTGRINSSTSVACNGIRSTSVHCNITGNYLYNVKGTGIDLNSTANIVSSNSIDYSDIAIRVRGSDNIITNNFWSGASVGLTTKTGIWVDNGSRNVIAHNNMQDGLVGILVDASLSANQLLYNLVYNNTTKITDNSSGYTTPTVSVGNITA